MSLPAHIDPACLSPASARQTFVLYRRLLIGFLCCLPLQFGCTRCALCLGGPPLRMPRRLKKCPPLVRVHSARTSSMSTGIGGALE